MKQPMSKDPNVRVKRKQEPSISELFDSIDDFLCHIEDFLHGEDGDSCSKSRADLAKLKELVSENLKSSQ